MIVTKSRAMLATPYRQAVLDVFRLCWMEVFFQVHDYLFARITIRPQERMIIANAVYTLTNLFLT